jgi:DNA-binding Lrp family transcriptional regulator
MICPVCGHQFSDDPLLHTLEKVQRNYGIIKTKTLAAFLPASESTALRILRSLERQGVLSRYGKKKGWHFQT